MGEQVTHAGERLQRCVPQGDCQNLIFSAYHMLHILQVLQYICILSTPLFLALVRDYLQSNLWLSLCHCTEESLYQQNTTHPPPFPLADNVTEQCTGSI